jgi:hypothetical protein
MRSTTHLINRSLAPASGGARPRAGMVDQLATTPQQATS